MCSFLLSVIITLLNYNVVRLQKSTSPLPYVKGRKRWWHFFHMQYEFLEDSVRNVAASSPSVLECFFSYSAIGMTLYPITMTLSLILQLQKKHINHTVVFYLQWCFCESPGRVVVSALSSKAGHSRIESTSGWMSFQDIGFWVHPILMDNLISRGNWSTKT